MLERQAWRKRLEYNKEGEEKTQQYKVKTNHVGELKAWHNAVIHKNKQFLQNKTLGTYTSMLCQQSRPHKITLYFQHALMLTLISSLIGSNVSTVLRWLKVTLLNYCSTALFPCLSLLHSAVEAGGVQMFLPIT